MRFIPGYPIIGTSTLISHMTINMYFVISLYVFPELLLFFPLLLMDVSAYGLISVEILLGWILRLASAELEDASQNIQLSLS
jgi:hypothetical protein